MEVLVFIYFQFFSLMSNVILLISSGSLTPYNPDKTINHGTLLSTTTTGPYSGSPNRGPSTSVAGFITQGMNNASK